MAVVKGEMLGGIAVSVTKCGNAAPLVACVNRLLALIVLIILTALCATVAVCDTFLSTGGSCATNKLKAAGVTGLGSKLNAYYKSVTDQEEVVNGLAVYINHKVGSKGIAVGGIKSCEEFDLSVGSYEIVLTVSNAVIARIMPDNTVLCLGSGGGVLLVGDDLIGRYTGVIGLLANYGYGNSKVESVKLFLRTGEVHKYTHGVVSLGNHSDLALYTVKNARNRKSGIVVEGKRAACLCLKIDNYSVSVAGLEAVVFGKLLVAICTVDPTDAVNGTCVDTVLCRIERRADVYLKVGLCANLGSINTAQFYFSDIGGVAGDCIFCRASVIALKIGIVAIVYREEEVTRGYAVESIIICIIVCKGTVACGLKVHTNTVGIANLEGEIRIHKLAVLKPLNPCNTNALGKRGYVIIGLFTCHGLLIALKLDSGYRLGCGELGFKKYIGIRLTSCIAVGRILTVYRIVKIVAIDKLIAACSIERYSEKIGSAANELIAGTKVLAGRLINPGNTVNESVIIIVGVD